VRVCAAYLSLESLSSGAIDSERSSDRLGVLRGAVCGAVVELVAGTQVRDRSAERSGFARHSGSRRASLLALKLTATRRVSHASPWCGTLSPASMCMLLGVRRGRAFRP
jgi:hypothetical protein